MPYRRNKVEITEEEFKSKIICFTYRVRFISLYIRSYTKQSLCNMLNYLFFPLLYQLSQFIDDYSQPFKNLHPLCNEITTTDYGGIEQMFAINCLQMF